MVGAAALPQRGLVSDSVFNLIAALRHYAVLVLLGTWLSVDALARQLSVVPLQAGAALVGAVVPGRRPLTDRERGRLVEAAGLFAALAVLWWVDVEALEEAVHRQRIVKLYWAAQLLLLFDRVYVGWLPTLLAYQCGPRSSAELLVSGVVSVGAYVLQTMLLALLVAVLRASSAGGGEGIGPGVAGGMSVLAMVVPMQFLSELRGSFVGWTRPRLVEAALVDVAQLGVNALVFLLGRSRSGGGASSTMLVGVAIFVAIDLALHVLKQMTILRDSGLPCDTHAGALAGVASDWAAGRRPALLDAFQVVSVSLAAVTVRSVHDFVVPALVPASALGMGTLPGSVMAAVAYPVAAAVVVAAGRVLRRLIVVWVSPGDDFGSGNIDTAGEESSLFQSSSTLAVPSGAAGDAAQQQTSVRRRAALSGKGQQQPRQ